MLEATQPLDPTGLYPLVVTGKRACPPEDCGGPGGYGFLLEALANPEDPEHAERVEWVGKGFDPEAFDADAINRRLHGKNYVAGAAKATSGAPKKKAKGGQMTLGLGGGNRQPL